MSVEPAVNEWTCGDVASLPLADAIEEQLLLALCRLSETLDVQGVCEAVLSGVESVFGASSSWIMLYNPATGMLRTALCRGRGADVYEGVEIPAHSGVAGEVFSKGAIQFVADASGDDRWFDPGQVCASGLTSVILVPLVARQKPGGILGVDSRRFGLRRPSAPIDVKRLEIFAAQAAIGLRNARLYATSQEDRARLSSLLNERQTFQREVLTLRDEVRPTHSFAGIVGESAALRRVLAEVERVAPSDVTVLLLGETGTGKELLARALHERSGRSRRAFVPVNCAALPEALVESEMFGHERGAFTGADARKPGRFELADRGSLFLDEIGDLPLNAQAKLLRVLQDGEVFPLGARRATKVDVRLIAATNRDLIAAVADGTFREDLFYRLSVFPIQIPPLRERADDIPLLARRLALECARRLGKRVSDIAPPALQAIVNYSWPGNVRELQNVVERAVILATTPTLETDTIRLNDAHNGAPQDDVEQQPGKSTRRDRDPITLADAERRAILDALRRAEGRISGGRGAAALLGLKPTTLHAKMKKLQVRRSDALGS